MNVRFVERLERLVWYAFLATAAWQTRLILWKADAVFSEWRSASLYLSDVVMISLFLLAMIRVRGRIRVQFGAGDYVLGFLVAAAILSLAHAQMITVGVYQLVRLIQFIVFFLYLRSWAWSVFDADRSAIAFVVGALGQAMLGIGQYVIQHDVGLRWLGETLLRTDMRGVAVFYDLAHVKILRAYGTLPHPNILAAYLMVAVWLLTWLCVRHQGILRRWSMLWLVALGVLMVGMYLTFSRTIIAVWICSWLLLAVMIWVPRLSGSWTNILEIRNRLRPIAVTFVVVSFGTLVLLWPQAVARMTISGSDEAVRLRVKYNNEAVSSGFGWSLAINWTGIGIGNFTSWLARYDRPLPSFVTQPAHNIFLIAYTEIGAFGLSLWLVWLAMMVRLARIAYRGQPLVRTGLVTLVVAFLAIGMLDHFFWTLQQGRILWWAVIALAAGRPSS